MHKTPILYSHKMQDLMGPGNIQLKCTKIISTLVQVALYKLRIQFPQLLVYDFLTFAINFNEND